MLALATLLYCLFVFGAGEQLFRDSDTGWHVRNGEWILDHHALPKSDPYSFSKAGEPWVVWEWGSDVLMGLANRFDGLRGVTELFALVIFATTWLCCKLQFAAGGDFFLTALLMPPIITTVSLHWLARPHLFSWPFLAAALLLAERKSASSGVLAFSAIEFGAIAALTALWANLHASFFFAPVIALIYAVGHLSRPLLWPLDRYTEIRKARWFLCAGIAAAAGSLLNPYGWRLHAHVFSYLQDDELTSRIAEFQSFNFHDKDATQVTIALCLAMAGGIAALTQKKLAHFTLAALFVWGGLRYARMLPLLALMILPLANGAFTESLNAVRGLRPRLKQAIEASLGYSCRLKLIDQRLNGAFFSLVGVLVLLLALHIPAFSNGIGFSPMRFPVQAAAAVDKLPSSARILAPDSYGGYLIYRYDGTRKVYFDGRSDFYGADFMKQYLVLISARPGWRQIARPFKFTHALLPDDSALKAALQQAGWATLYKDKVATLLENR